MSLIVRMAITITSPANATTTAAVTVLTDTGEGVVYGTHRNDKGIFIRMIVVTTTFHQFLRLLPMYGTVIVSCKGCRCFCLVGSWDSFLSFIVILTNEMVVFRQYWSKITY